jgi:ribonuclease P protein subunit POP4
MRGVSGIIIDETKNTLKISTVRKKVLTIPKKDNSFIFFLQDDTKLMTHGNILIGRPEDRIGKR